MTPQQDPAVTPPEPGQGVQENAGVGSAMDGYTKESHGFMTREIQAAQGAQQAAEAQVADMQQKTTEAEWYINTLTEMANHPEFGSIVNDFVQGRPAPGSSDPASTPAQQQQNPAQGQVPPATPDGSTVTQNQLAQTMKAFEQNLQQRYNPYLSKLNNVVFGREVQDLVTKFGQQTVEKAKPAMMQLLNANPDMGLEKAFKMSALDDLISAAENRGREKGRVDSRFMTEPPGSGGVEVETERSAEMTEADRLMLTGNENDEEKAIGIYAAKNIRAQQGGA